MSSSPSAGTRICVANYLGTVRFVGEVRGTKGTWLGIEWDDASRGKHDGIKDGVQYFTCSIPGAGSFIRPTASINYGRPFLEALTEKYVEIARGSAAKELVTLGSSNGTIQVEAVNLDKIRDSFARLERLRIISLDKENVSSADQAGLIRAKCPNVKAVDLSYSLLPSWDVVALIAGELPLLERLTLNNNRLQPFASLSLASNAFARLTELQINATLMGWIDMLDVTSLMPALKLVEMGYNRLTHLAPPATHHKLPPLELVNLDGNSLSNWLDICQALAPFSQLNRLILSSNPLPSIAESNADTSTPQLLQVKHLALIATGITTWSSIDALNHWLPGLESLSLSGTPLTKDPTTTRSWRQIAIARLPTLRVLDGSTVTPPQRADAELFYMSLVARLPPDARTAHPRWAALCTQYGAPDPPPVRAKEDTLRNQLITINATLRHAAATATPVRVLPNTPLRVLRLKLLKTFKAPRGAIAEVSVRMRDGGLVPLGDADGEDDAREISWWLEDGAEVELAIRA